MKEEGLSW